MRIIHKYKLNDKMLIPSDYKILSIQEQNNELFMWALVDPDADNVEIYTECIWTGQDLEADMSKHHHLATLQTKRGFVEHVFQIIK